MELGLQLKVGCESSICSCAASGLEVILPDDRLRCDKAVHKRGARVGPAGPTSLDFACSTYRRRSRSSGCLQRRWFSAAGPGLAGTFFGLAALRILGQQVHVYSCSPQKLLPAAKMVGSHSMYACTCGKWRMSSKLRFTIPELTELELADMAFSRCGSRLYALSRPNACAFPLLGSCQTTCAVGRATSKKLQTYSMLTGQPLPGGGPTRNFEICGKSFCLQRC